jgi:hypothetical protein
VAKNFFDDPKYSSAPRPATPFASPVLPTMLPQAQANVQKTQAEIPGTQATTAKTQAETITENAKRPATLRQANAEAQKSEFQASQEGITLQRQEAQTKMFGDIIGKMMDSVQQARQLIIDNPGQFGPAAYRVLEHIPGTAANKFATLIDQQHGPLASNQVLSTINTFRDEAGANPGGGGAAPRVFRSEIPLFVNQAGALDPGSMGAAATMHTLDNMEYYGKRANAAVNGANPDSPDAAKQFGIPPVPTMEGAQQKLAGLDPGVAGNEVKFNDEGKPGQLTPQQQAQEQAYLRANPNVDPAAFGTFLNGLTGRKVTNASQILTDYHRGAGLNANIIPDPQALAIANQALAKANAPGAAIGGVAAAVPFQPQIGAGVQSLINKVTGQGSPSYQTNLDANILYNEGLAKRQPIPFFGGQLAGGAALMSGAGMFGRSLLGAAGDGGQAILDAAASNPRTATALGDMAYGGATSAGQNPNAPVTGGMFGAAAGLGGNVLGRAVQAAGGKALSAAGQRLNTLGINVPIWPRVLPGGDARVGEQNAQINSEAFNQAANIVGGDNGVAPDLPSLQSLGQDAYNHALNPVTSLTPQTHPGFVAAVNAANALDNPAARTYALRSLNQNIVKNVNNGVMDGPGFQTAYRNLSNDIGGIPNLVNNAKISQSEGTALKNILGQGQDALVGTLQQSNPEAFGNFLAANNMWRHMNVLAKATDAARNSIDASGNPIPTVAQLSNASSANTRAYSGLMAAAQGNRPFNQLLDDANYAAAKSGGPGLLSQASHYALPTLALLAGGGTGAQADGEEGAGIGALGALALTGGLGTRAGQAALRHMMLMAPNAFTAAFVPMTPNLNGGQ